jgi:putative transposase
MTTTRQATVTGASPTSGGRVSSRDGRRARRRLAAGGGVPLGCAVEGAHRHDCKRVEATRPSLPSARPTPPPAQPQGMGRDQGADEDEGRALRAAFGCTAPSQARGEEATARTQEPGCKARRWVVERTPRWMNRFRRVLRRWDKTVRHALALLHVAYAYSPYRQAGLLG